MRAKVTKAFPGVPDGQVWPKEFAIDGIVEGDLAKVAIANKWAVEVADEAEPAAAETDVEKMTLDQLKAHAAAESIDIGEAKKKADILALIKAAAQAGQ